MSDRRFESLPLTKTNRLMTNLAFKKRTSLNFSSYKIFSVGKHGREKYNMG